MYLRKIIFLLYIMYILMLDYLILLTALFNAVCLHNAYLFYADDFCKCFLLSYFFFGLHTHSLVISFII